MYDFIYNLWFIYGGYDGNGRKKNETYNNENIRINSPFGCTPIPPSIKLEADCFPGRKNRKQAGPTLGGTGAQIYWGKVIQGRARYGSVEAGNMIFTHTCICKPSTNWLQIFIDLPICSGRRSANQRWLEQIWGGASYGPVSKRMAAFVLTMRNVFRRNPTNEWPTRWLPEFQQR